ncbi:MAG TPA: transcription antitermination factor NusB [Stellaceae bacterium]|jgi:N utilization substance protein B
MSAADDHTTRDGRQRVGGRRRTVARLAAVQALYQLELNPALDAQAVVREFARYRFDQDIDGDQLAEADPAFFADIVHGVTAEQERLDADISAALVEEWPLARLDAVLRAILRAGAWELTQRPDVPPRVAISEYIAIAHAFFTGKEPGLANGVLDRLARTLRAADM